MAGFFDLNDPMSLYQLQGALQGLSSVSGPSRLPVGFGNQLAATAGGLLGGRIKGQQEQAGQDFYKSLAQPQQGPAPMGFSRRT